MRRPKTLAEFKQQQPAEYVELGKLQPDLNAQDLVLKVRRARRASLLRRC